MNYELLVGSDANASEFGWLSAVSVADAKLMGSGGLAAEDEPLV
jgi:hypothetical protein